MSALAAIVDTGALVHVVWVSFLAGVAVVTIYSLAILGFARAQDARREGRRLAGAVFGAFGAVALALFAAVIVLGVGVLVG